MRKLVYSGLMAVGLAGLIGCDTERKTIIESIPMADLPTLRYPISASSTSMVIGDMNGDGKNDIIISCHLYGEHGMPKYRGIYIYLNNGDGSYSPQVPYIKAEKAENEKR